MKRAGRLKDFPTAIPVVAAILVARDGRVLLHRRPPGKRHAGLWEFPGGKVEPGESREAALVREIEEELGLVLRAEDLSLAMTAQDDSGEPRDPHVLFLYTCRTWRGEPACLEGGAVAWFTPAEALQLDVAPLDVAPVARLAAIVAAAGHGR